MGPGNPDERPMAQGPDADLNVKQVPLLQRPHGNGRLFQVVRHGGDFRLTDLRQHLQLPFRPACDDACRGSGRNSPQSAGVGNHHALHIFDDIGADPDVHPFRQNAQGLPGQRGGIGHGDGLCAAHRRDQLLPENSDKRTV